MRPAETDDLETLLDLMADFYAEADYVLDRPHAEEAFVALLADFPPRAGLAHRAGLRSSRLRRLHLRVRDGVRRAHGGHRRLLRWASSALQNGRAAADTGQRTSSDEGGASEKDPAGSSARRPARDRLCAAGARRGRPGVHAAQRRGHHEGSHRARRDPAGGEPRAAGRDAAGLPGREARVETRGPRDDRPRPRRHRPARPYSLGPRHRAQARGDDRQRPRHPR